MPDSYHFKGKNYPTPPDPPERVCFIIEIPDSIEYRAALYGQLEWLADWRCWRHDNVAYTDPPQVNRDIAALFAEAIAGAGFEDCMDCEQVKDCIENDADTRAAIGALIQAGSEIPASYPYGENLPNSRVTQNLAGSSNPGCNLDILWAQCLGLIQATAAAIRFTLNQTEASTNVIELANGILGSIPGVAAAEKAIGIEGVIDLINYFQESVAEGFNAQYSETPGGVQDQLTCALFCKCQSDCIITIERIFLVMQSRIRVYQAVPNLSGFVNLVETIAGINVDTTFVVDMAFYVSFAAMKTANLLFMNAGNKILDLVVALKKDEPSNDWETLCDDCPDECLEPSWRVVNPVGTAGGSYVQTDNLDGTWTVVFSSAFSSGAHRLAVVENSGCCWNVITADYSYVPENLNKYYECGAEPTDSDYGLGSIDGSVPANQCSAGVLAASVSSAFTVTVVYEAC